MKIFFAQSDYVASRLKGNPDAIPRCPACIHYVSWSFIRSFSFKHACMLDFTGTACSTRTTLRPCEKFKTVLPASKNLHCGLGPSIKLTKLLPSGNFVVLYTNGVHKTGEQSKNLRRAFNGYQKHRLLTLSILTESQEV